MVWNLGTMAAGSSRTITVVVKVNSGQTANLSNTATVTSTTTDPVQSNNSDTEPTVVITQADVKIVKTASVAVASPGDNLTYTLTVSNDGPSDALSVVVNDTLPTGVTFVSASPAASSGPNPLTWNLGTLTAGQTRTITVVVTINSNATGQITNLATVNSATTDPDPTNNSSSTTTDITNQADLKILKYGPTMPVQSETEFTYTIVVQNLGPAVARNVVVVDSLPVDVSYVDASPVAVQTNNTLTWYLGDMQSGETRLIYLTVFVEPWANDEFTNVTTVSSSTPDPVTSNNSDDEVTTVGYPTAVTITSFQSTGTNGRQVSLNWTLASEVDVFSYNIYRSSSNDINTAEVIHTEPANGSLGYSLMDTVPVDGNYWYWITFVSMSGAESPVQGTFQVTVTSSGSVKLYLPLVKR
jgi:uncharacterized repeat protein (TIGR01451 family)